MGTKCGDAAAPRWLRSYLQRACRTRRVDARGDVVLGTGADLCPACPDALDAAEARDMRAPGNRCLPFPRHHCLRLSGIAGLPQERGHSSRFHFRRDPAHRRTESPPTAARALAARLRTDCSAIPYCGDRQGVKVQVSSQLRPSFAKSFAHPQRTLRDSTRKGAG